MDGTFNFVSQTLTVDASTDAVYGGTNNRGTWIVQNPDNLSQFVGVKEGSTTESWAYSFSYDDVGNTLDYSGEVTITKTSAQYDITTHFSGSLLALQNGVVLYRNYTDLNIIRSAFTASPAVTRLTSFCGLSPNGSGRWHTLINAGAINEENFDVVAFGARETSSFGYFPWWFHAKSMWLLRAQSRNPTLTFPIGDIEVTASPAATNSAINVYLDDQENVADASGDSLTTTIGPFHFFQIPFNDRFKYAPNVVHFNRAVAGQAAVNVWTRPGVGIFDKLTVRNQTYASASNMGAITDINDYDGSFYTSGYSTYYIAEFWGP